MPRRIEYDAAMNRFWNKVNKKGPDECWEWTAGIRYKGYGAFNIGGGVVGSNRMAYCLDKGLELSDIRGKCVCHSCDNPPCCNPAHLWLGTQIDNIKDRDNKGRGSYVAGEKHPGAKLDNDDVMFIHAWLKSGYTKQSIADAFEVSQRNIGKIHKGIRWSHIKQI